MKLTWLAGVICRQRSACWRTHEEWRAYVPSHTAVSFRCRSTSFTLCLSITPSCDEPSSRSPRSDLIRSAKISSSALERTSRTTLTPSARSLCMVIVSHLHKLSRPLLTAQGCILLTLHASSAFTLRFRLSVWYCGCVNNSKYGSRAIKRTCN